MLSGDERQGALATILHYDMSYFPEYHGMKNMDIAENVISQWKSGGFPVKLLGVQQIADRFEFRVNFGEALCLEAEANDKTGIIFEVDNLVSRIQKFEDIVDDYHDSLVKISAQEKVIKEATVALGDIFVSTTIYASMHGFATFQSPGEVWRWIRENKDCKRALELTLGGISKRKVYDGICQSWKSRLDKTHPMKLEHLDELAALMTRLLQYSEYSLPVDDFICHFHERYQSWRAEFIVPEIAYPLKKREASTS